MSIYMQYDAGTDATRSELVFQLAFWILAVLVWITDKNY